MAQLPRRIPETSLILTPEYIHPALNRQRRRWHLKLKIKHHHHITPVGDIYEKSKDGDKKIKSKRYGDKFL